MFRKANKKEEVYSFGRVDEFFAKYELCPNVLGSGSYAQVRLAREKSRDKEVAVKILKKSNMTKITQKNFEKEVKILAAIRHENVVEFYGAYYDEESEKYFIVMEYCSEGDLFRKVMELEKNEKAYSKEDVKKWTTQICLGVQHCHKNGVVHRDVKLDNVLLDKNKNAKVADFNLSRILESEEQAHLNAIKTLCGTPDYLAPEVVSKKLYSSKCDVWSVGIILYALLSGGYVPYAADEEIKDEIERRNNLFKKIKERDWEFVPKEVWDTIDLEAKDLVINMLVKEPKDRFNFAQVLQHKWLKN